MDFFEYDFQKETVEEKLLAFKKWYKRLFKKYKKELKTDIVRKNKKGEPTKIIFKLITAIGTFTGTGTIYSTAIENAIFAFRVGFIKFKEKRRIMKEKKTRKTKMVRMFKKQYYKFVNNQRKRA